MCGLVRWCNPITIDVQEDTKNKIEVENMKGELKSVKGAIEGITGSVYRNKKLLKTIKIIMVLSLLMHIMQVFVFTVRN